MIIRKAKLEDVDAVVELWKEFMTYHDTLIIKKDKRFKTQLPKKKNAHILFKKFIEEKIRSKDAVIYVAEVDDELVGYSLIFIKDNIPIFYVEKLGHVGDLFVKTEHHGKRISSMFKEKAIEWFKKKGVKNLSISVYPDNEHARNIYKRWGFFDYHVEMRKKL